MAKPPATFVPTLILLSMILLLKIRDLAIQLAFAALAKYRRRYKF
jgi:hypothetical protein